MLDEAERISRILLSLTAFVALLTSFFIILTTMSMSLFERRRSMGVLRCVGSTRGQLSWLLSIEMIPLGLFGTVLGVLLGMAVTEFCSVCLPSGHAPIVASKWGVQLAVASGMLTTLVSTAFLLFQVCRVTPLAALNPDIRAPRKAGLYLSGVFGIGFLLVHEGIVRDPDQTQWLGASFATVGVTSLYLGYILLTPRAGGPAGRAGFAIGGTASRYTPGVGVRSVRAGAVAMHRSVLGAHGGPFAHRVPGDRFGSNARSLGLPGQAPGGLRVVAAVRSR